MKIFSFIFKYKKNYNFNNCHIKEPLNNIIASPYDSKFNLKRFSTYYVFLLLLISIHAYGVANHEESHKAPSSMQKFITVALANILISIDKLHSVSPMTSRLLKATLLKSAELATPFFDGYIIDYSHIKRMSDYAKSTEKGYYDIEFKGKTLYFIANADIASKLMQFEGKANNTFTERRLLIKKNFFLLENNPVASSDMNHHTYGRQLAEFFRVAFDKIQKMQSIDLLFIDNHSSKEGHLHGNQIEDMVNDLLIQIYFQLFFSNVNTEYPINKKIQARVKDNFKSIKLFYKNLEGYTGKYNLNANDFMQGIKPFEKLYPYGSTLLLDSFYHILCQLYDKTPSSEYVKSRYKSLTDREIIALKIIELLQSNDAAILPVFEPGLTGNIKKIEPQEAINIVYNLLSCIDNALNVNNTAINFIIHVAEHHKKDQNHIDMKTLFNDEIHNLRALATLFLRKVKAPFSIEIKNNGIKNSIKFNSGDAILITNSIKGHALGYEPRKCPSKPYSTYIIPNFLQYIFKYYHADLNGSSGLKPNTGSWFWNKLDVTPLVLKPVTQ